MNPEALARVKRIIRDEIAQLERWAEESSRGGWSTHQVTPMRERAKDLAYELYRLESI